MFGHLSANHRFLQPGKQRFGLCEGKPDVVRRGRQHRTGDAYHLHRLHLAPARLRLQPDRPFHEPLPRSRSMRVTSPQTHCPASPGCLRFLPLSNATAFASRTLREEVRQGPAPERNPMIGGEPRFRDGNDRMIVTQSPYDCRRRRYGAERNHHAQRGDAKAFVRGKGIRMKYRQSVAFTLRQRLRSSRPGHRRRRACRIGTRKHPSSTWS